MIEFDGIEELKQSTSSLQASLRRIDTRLIAEANNAKLSNAYKNELERFSPKQVTGRLKSSWQIKEIIKGNSASFDANSNAKSNKGFSYASAVARGAFGGKVGQEIEAPTFMRGYARSVGSRKRNLWFTFSHNTKGKGDMIGRRAKKIRLAGQPAQDYDLQAFDSMVSGGIFDEYLQEIADSISFK